MVTVNQIKVFSLTTLDKLQLMVNKWLDENYSIVVRDIQYHSERGFITALIHYVESLDKKDLEDNDYHEEECGVCGTLYDDRQPHDCED